MSTREKVKRKAVVALILFLCIFVTLILNGIILGYRSLMPDVINDRLWSNHPLGDPNQQNATNNSFRGNETHLNQSIVLPGNTSSLWDDPNYEKPQNFASVLAYITA